MSSKRIPLTRTSPLEQRRRQQNNLQPEVDAGRGWRGTSHGSESYAGDDRGDARARRYHLASGHNVPADGEDAEAVFDMPSHYQGPPAVFGRDHGGGGLSISSPRREESAMSGAGYGGQGASAYGGRGGGYGKYTPSHLESTMSSASMMSEDSDGYGRRAPQEAPVLFENYGGGYGGRPPHLQQNQMSGALSTTSKLLHEYAGRDRRGAAFAPGANGGEYPAYPSLYDHADIEKLMDEYAGRTHPGPSTAYPQRYVESVEAALRVHAGGLDGPNPYQAEPQLLRGEPAMSRRGRQGGSGRRRLSRLPSHAGSNESFDGNIQGHRSVPQDKSFVRTRSRPSDMHSHSQRRSQPSESIEDIMERFDLGDGRGSRYDSHSRH